MDWAAHGMGCLFCVGFLWRSLCSRGLVIIYLGGRVLDEGFLSVASKLACSQIKDSDRMNSLHLANAKINEKPIRKYISDYRK